MDLPVPVVVGVVGHALQRVVVCALLRVVGHAFLRVVGYALLRVVGHVFLRVLGYALLRVVDHALLRVVCGGPGAGGGHPPRALDGGGFLLPPFFRLSL